jgi:hypothetical protein
MAFTFAMSLSYAYSFYCHENPPQLRVFGRFFVESEGLRRRLGWQVVDRRRLARGIAVFKRNHCGELAAHLPIAAKGS